ncbi:MAG: hypothetical protein AAB676_01865 [Verrucomicrobiota bacterium]
MNLPLGLGTGFTQGLDESKTILIIGKDGFLRVPSIDQVANRSRIFHSDFACHNA